MNLKNIVYDILLEEFQNKKLLSFLHDQWKKENNGLTIQDVEFIAIRFMGGKDDDGTVIPPLKDKLSTKRPQVKSFLNRFDGEYDTSVFDPKNLKDITKYSLKQIKSLFLEFNINLETIMSSEEYFYEKGGVSKDEKVAYSENYWKGDSLKIYDDGEGFRIYEPKNQRDSILFGYYQQKVASENFPDRSNKWCVTNKPGEQSMGNLWASYRNERSYYFVIDETKDPTNQFHLSVVQPLTNSSDEYSFRITNLPNTNGDAKIKLQDNDVNSCLQCIYPQLRNEEALSKLKVKPYNEVDELNVKTDVATRVNETEGNRYEFRRVERPLKVRYIQNGGILSKKSSFESMDDDLVRFYINELTNNNVDDMFNNYESFKYLINRSGVKGALSEKLLRVAEENNMDPKYFGISTIMLNIIKHQFKTVFISKQDSDIKIVESKDNRLIGILDGSTGEWVKLNGIKYGPDYKELKTDYGVFDFDGENEKVDDVNPTPEEEPSDDIEKDNLQEQIDEQTTYVVQTYSKDGNESSSDNFYVIDNIIDGTAEVTILSHKTWESVGKPSFLPVDSDKYDFDKPYNTIDSKVQGPINEKEETI